MVQSRFGATVAGLPSGFTEIPFFPGVEVEKIMGKKFETMALDIQVLDSPVNLYVLHFLYISKNVYVSFLG